MEDKTNEFKKKLAQAIKVAVEERTKDTERRIMTSLGKDVAELLKPFLSDLAQSSKASKENLREVMQELAGSASAREFAGVDTGAIIEAIYVAFGSVAMPQPKVTVTSPKIDIPALKWPEGKMPIEGFVRLMGYDYKNPFPVQLWDGNGKPVDLSALRPAVSVGGGSGKADFFTIKGFSQSAYADLMNADGRLRVSVETGGSGLTDSELRASSVPVAQASDAVWSTSVVAVTDIFSTTSASTVVNPDNRVRVELPAGTTGLTDSELRASSVPVAQASGASWSTSVVAVSDIFSTTSASSVVNPDNRVKVELPTGSSGLTDTELRASSVPVAQASGASWSTAVVSVSDIFSTTSASTVVNPDNRVKVELPATSVTVSSITASTAAALVDSGGAQYSGSNPVPTYLVAGSGNSTISVGDIASGTADTGSAPVKVGGIARTTNPTAEADGDRISFTGDDLGRQVTRPVQVRDLTKTAYVQITNGTETTLRAAVAGAFLDLIYIMGANNSDAAVSVDIRAVTGGNVMLTLQIPASGTAGIACPVPLPQDATGNNWTADMGDITGTTVSLTALFSQEV